jgi:hypothetical protein
MDFVVKWFIVRVNGQKAIFSERQVAEAIEGGNPVEKLAGPYSRFSQAEDYFNVYN